MDTHTRRNILLALTFLAGCVASRVQWAPPALAQSETSTPRWDYHCSKPEFFFGQTGTKEQIMTAHLKAAGQQGWELVTVDEGLSFCFKRPLR